MFGTPIPFDNHIRGSFHQDEHRIAVFPLMNDFLAPAKMNDASAGQQGVELLIAETLEERLLTQNDSRRVLKLLLFVTPRAFEHERPRRERNADTVAMQAIPNISPDGIADIGKLS